MNKNERKGTYLLKQHFAFTTDIVQGQEHQDTFRTRSTDKTIRNIRGQYKRTHNAANRTHVNPRPCLRFMLQSRRFVTTVHVSTLFVYIHALDSPPPIFPQAVDQKGQIARSRHNTTLTHTRIDPSTSTPTLNNTKNISHLGYCSLKTPNLQIHHTICAIDA